MKKIQDIEIISTKEFKEFIEDLAYFANNYITKIRRQLTENAFEIYQNETVKKMLHEYRVLAEKDLKDLIYGMQHQIENPDSNCNLDSLSGANHYSNVLYDLLIKEKS
jgi:hypothetical protein